MQEQASCLEKDRETTLQHRRNIAASPNLLLWYRELYGRMLDRMGYQAGQRVLEVGSGASILSDFHPEILTSDLLALDHVRFRLDGQRLDEYPEIASLSLDGIVMSNVLHHMREPLRFFRSAEKVLRPGGRICLLEPYFSLLGSALYRSTAFIHQEGIDFSAAGPDMPSYAGPLSSANMAMPQMILLEKRFSEEVDRAYRITAVSHFTSLAYFVSGGAKRAFPVPQSLYRAFLDLDLRLASAFPRLFATFFIAVLEKRRP